MTEVGVGFGVALVAAAVTTPFSSHRMAASACAAMLAIGWAVAVVVSPYIEGPKDLLIYAALDVIFGVAVVHMLIDRPAVWKVALAYFVGDALVVFACSPLVDGQFDQHGFLFKHGLSLSEPCKQGSWVDY